MQIVEATAHHGAIQTTNPEDNTLPSKLQSHLAHLLRYVSPASKALSLSQQSLAYYLTGVLNASIGFQALHLTHPTTALQPATGAITKALAAHGGWSTSIPTPAIRAARPQYRDAIGDELKVLHQANRPPPSPHDSQPLTGSSRSRHDPPPNRTTGPQHMPTLDTPPDGHAHQYQHTPVQQLETSTPFPTPRHTHKPHMSGGRTPGGPLRGPPPSPQRHHRHHRPRWGLHHSSICRPPPNAGPSPQRGTPHPIPTTSQMASIPPLLPVPHRVGTSGGAHSAGKPRHEGSLPGLKKSNTPVPSQRHRPTHPPARNTNSSPR